MSERLTDEMIAFYDQRAKEGHTINREHVAKIASELVHYKKLAEERGKQIERCLIGGNSLASVMIGLSLPEEWHDWTHHQASEYFYGHYVEGQAFEYYETWLCWKALHDVGKEQQP